MGETDAIEQRDVSVVSVDGHLLQGLMMARADALPVVVASVNRGGVHSGANQFLTELLARSGFSALLVDLLTPEEHDEDAEQADLRYDIGFLTARLASVLDWLRDNFGPTRVGIIAEGTGAGAALSVAAERPKDIGAVMCRGGRPDLAGDTLRRVTAPTLLVVGGADSPLVDLNREAAGWLKGEYRMEVVKNAAGLSGNQPEPLDTVGALAVEWFRRQLPGVAQ